MTILVQQVAPGITENRPQSGSQPVTTIDHTHSGYATGMAQNWYENLTVAGNTSLNPFFYGTWLGETKPNEPVTRNKRQAFQADAVGAMHQLTPSHFQTPHTFRVEWQPGRGGRLDWFTKTYKKKDENGNTFHMEGDGKGQDWEHSLSIPDFALDEAVGSKIPEEPSYIIFNTAISSTWAFPYDVPEWCPKCYDCDDPKCACSFNPGFCNMMKTGKVALKIDSVRVYQSKDDDAHSGQPHGLGCDPVEFPTREYIKGYEYRYMRPLPFSFADKHPLHDVKNGGGTCKVDDHCGGGGVENTEVDESWEIPDATKKKSKAGKEDVIDLDAESSLQSPKNRKLGEDISATMTATNGNGNSPRTDDNGLDKPPIAEESLEDNEIDTKVLSNPDRTPKGQCVTSTQGLFGPPTSTGKQCKCNKGYTGPHCLSIDKYDVELGALELKQITHIFSQRAMPYLTRTHLFIGGTLVGAFLVAISTDIVRKNGRAKSESSPIE